MNIKRTDPTRPPREDPAKAQKSEQKGGPFTTSGSRPVETTAIAAAGVPPSVTQADLRDPAKLEEILTRCFGDLVDDAGRQMGGPVSQAQRRDLLEFLKTDPVTRGKLLKYLEQVVK